MKKIISLVLAVVILCSTFAGLQLTANAAMPKSGKCGENVSYTFDDKSGLLTISGSGDMYDYDGFEGNSPFYFSDTITKVIINKGVTRIGSAAFTYCEELLSISIPDTVTTIGVWSLKDCPKLKEITIPSSVVKIETCAFENCSKLQQLFIPATCSVVDEQAFLGCEGLISIQVEAGNPNYDSRNNCNAIIVKSSNTLLLGCKNTVIPDTVVCIGEGAFWDCHNLTNIDIPDSVVKIEKNAFANCFKLTSITIPASVTELEGAFESDYLQRISIDKANPIYDSRNNCNAIIETGTNTLLLGCRNTVIPNTVKVIGDDAFYTCFSLKSIVIPNSVVLIRDGAFIHCNSLTNITISNSVKSIDEYAFFGCDQLSDVYYSGSPTQWKQIKIGEDNEALTSAKIHYYHNASTLKLFQCTARTAAAEKLEWNKVAGAAGYQVQISNAAGNKWAKAYNVTGTSFVFKNLATGSNYKFRVRFYKKAAGGKVVFSAWSKTLASPTLPKATSLTKLVGGKKCFAAQWRRSAVTGYQLQYSTNAKFTGAKTVTVRNAKAYKTLVNKLAEKKVYFVRARTYKTFAKVNYFSTWSKTYKVKTK